MDSFKSAHIRINSAKGGIEEIDSLTKAYIASNPYAIVVEPNTDGTRNLCKAKLITPIPNAIISVCGHVVRDLRLALDNIVAGCAIANNESPALIGFPFVGNIADFDDRAKGRCKGVPAQIVALFKGFQPYHGGDELLVALNNLSNQGHISLVAIGHRIQGMSYDIHIHRGKGPFGIWNSPWDTEKNEMLLFESGPDIPHMEYKATLAIGIAFGEIEVVKGKPILAVLNALCSKVEGIVAATEAEIERLFPRG